MYNNSFSFSQGVWKAFLCVIALIFYSLLSMSDCQYCAKSFGNKDGLKQHCKGKKHLENMETWGKRKEPDPLATAMRAATIAMEAEALQQYQKRVEAPRATTAMEAEALQQFQKSVAAARAAQKASETDARVERQNIAMEAEALQQFQKSVEAARAAQKASETDARVERQNVSSDEAASIKAARAAKFAEYLNSVPETSALSYWCIIDLL